MPILSVNSYTSWDDLVPISQKWTYWDVASLVRIQTKQLASDIIQDDDIRLYVNLNISYLADQLNIAAESWYGVSIGANLESPAHYSGLDYVDLTNGFVDTLNVFNKMHSIDRVSVRKVVSYGDRYWGNATKMTLAQITQLKANLNRNHDQTVAYAVHGKDLLLFVGRDIASPTNTGTLPKYVNIGEIVIWAYRQPLLDDMLIAYTSGPSTDRSKTYNISGTNNWISNYIDLPDRYMKLLVDMTTKSVYQQLQERPPMEIEQSILQGLASIGQTAQMAQQKQAVSSEKPYSTPIQPGGANA